MWLHSLFHYPVWPNEIIITKIILLSNSTPSAFVTCGSSSGRTVPTVTAGVKLTTHRHTVTWGNSTCAVDFEAAVDRTSSRSLQTSALSVSAEIHSLD